MDKATEKVIIQIAEIQLDAIKIAKEEHLNKDKLKDLWGYTVYNKDIDLVVSRLVEMYRQLINLPETIRLLPGYQLKLCSSILSSNYDTWSLDNIEGVHGAFELIENLIKNSKY